MSEPRTCPQCGSDLPPDAPDGLCPTCLLNAGFESRPAPVGPAPVGPADAAGPEPGAGRPQVAAQRTAAYQPRTLPPSIAELAARFPQLELLEQIGQGGMGVVYKARQKNLDRIVALKILRPDFESDPAFAQRFGREARALARLSHPAIVAVYDSGQTDGFYYFVMEYVDGPNLRELERSGKLTSQQALALVPQICEALQYAHDQGVVHRDIKPENLMIDKQGRVKIADFGLAKITGAVVDAATLTGAWQVMGTPHYMAPEQMQRTREVDHRADIYSLGVVIYEMLTGELPVGRFPLPSQKVQVDVRLDEVVLRAMEREPERRYQHASEVKTDLESISDRAHASAPAASAGPENEVVRLLHGGQRIGAIAAYRRATGSGLVEARRAVEAIAVRHGIPTRALTPGQRAWQIALVSAVLALILGWISAAGLPAITQGLIFGAGVLLYLAFLAAMWIGARKDAERLEGRGDASAQALPPRPAPWRRVVERFPGAIRLALAMIYVVGLWIFFGSRGSGGPGWSRLEYTIGAPVPWFEFQLEADRSHHFAVNLLSPAWLAALAAFGCLHLMLRIRPSDQPVSVWELPRTHAAGWFVAALIGTTWGFIPAALGLPEEAGVGRVIGPLLPPAVWLVAIVGVVIWLVRQRRAEAASEPTG